MPVAPIAETQFRDYPPAARDVATRHLRLFQQLPPAFAALLLQQVQGYDWRFPAERREIDQQLSYLEALSGEERRNLLGGFERLQLPPKAKDWASAPGEFSEQLSAYLWSTHQIDAFREAASSYLQEFRASLPPPSPPLPRLGIAVIGHGVESNAYPLFRKLRPEGTYFTRVNPSNGLGILLAAAAARATAHPLPFGHWYVDGDKAEPIATTSLTTISYARLAPVRAALLAKVDRAIHGGIGGPEPLLAMMHTMQPRDIGLPGGPGDAVLSRFQASLLTEGSGTQIFSTTFVQWTTRELWRRAQPLTILARFAPRQRQRPMNELLAAEPTHPQLDPQGSLIDADMGAWYMWIDQQRLPGAGAASFLVWFEGHQEALAISPTLPRNAVSEHELDMQALLNYIG